MHEQKIFARRGWLAAVVILPALVVASFSQPLFCEGEPGDMGFDLLGWLLLGGGVFMRLWATLYIGGRKSISMVTEGPYAMCRHPLYLGSFLIILALACFMASPVVLAATIIVGLFYAFVIVPSEERHAESCFGEAYCAYAAVTPRFVPRFRNLRRPGRIEIKVAEFLREFSRMYGAVAIGATAEFLAYCRPQPWWPKLFRLP